MPGSHFPIPQLKVLPLSLANRREAPRSPEGERRDESQGR